MMISCLGIRLETVVKSNFKVSSSEIVSACSFESNHEHLYALKGPFLMVLAPDLYLESLLVFSKLEIWCPTIQNPHFMYYTFFKK